MKNSLPWWGDFLKTQNPYKYIHNALTYTLVNWTHFSNSLANKISHQAISYNSCDELSYFCRLTLSHLESQNWDSYEICLWNSNTVIPLKTEHSKLEPIRIAMQIPMCDELSSTLRYITSWQSRLLHHLYSIPLRFLHAKSELVLCFFFKTPLPIPQTFQTPY